MNLTTFDRAANACIYTQMSDLECTCSALRMAARRLTQAYDAALAPEGLTVAQYAILSRLARRPAGDHPIMQDLADDLALDRTTLGHNLRPLERDGLLAVGVDAHDRRQRRIRLTAAGQAKRERCLPLWREAQERFDAGFGREPSRTLRATLAAIIDLSSGPSGRGERQHAG